MQAEKSIYPLLYPLYLSGWMWAIKGSCLLANELIYCISPTPPALGGRLEEATARASLKRSSLTCRSAPPFSLWPASHLLPPGPPSLQCPPWPVYRKNLWLQLFHPLLAGRSWLHGLGCYGVVGCGCEVKWGCRPSDLHSLHLTCENISTHNGSTERFPWTMGGKGK